MTNRLPKRGPSRPLTTTDLRDALAETTKEIVGRLTRTQSVFAESVDRRFLEVDRRFVGVDMRFDRLEREVREGFERMDEKLDATLQIFPTRKEIGVAHQRLSRILKPHGIDVDPEALLKP